MTENFDSFDAGSRNDLSKDEGVLLINIIMEFMKNANKVQSPQQTNDNMVKFIREFGQKQYDKGFATAMGSTLKEQ